MKLFRLIARPGGLASMHGLFALPIDASPLTGIGVSGMPSKPGRRPEKRKRLLAYLRAQLARRSWRQPA